MNRTQGDILVVDDQPVNVRLLATMLSQLGYKVRKATSAEMALTAIHAEPPDLVLLDITMPQMDGYELCQILKQNPLTADIPVIFVSALDESMDKAKAFEVGAVDYVAKPFQWVEVQARVKTQLALRQLQQALGAHSGSPGQQFALWAESTPAIAPFHLTSRAQANPITQNELYDWQLKQPHLLYLTLAHTTLGTSSSAAVLATVRGLFKGLSLEPNLNTRIAQAQSLIAPDLSQSGESLCLFHGELNGDNATLSYGTQGYAVGLVRQNVVNPQATAATLQLEPGDRLWIARKDLQNNQPQLIETLISREEGAKFSEVGSVLILDYRA